MFDGTSIFVLIGVLGLAGLIGFALVITPLGFDATTLRGSVEMTSKTLFDTAQTGPGYFVLFEVLGLLLLSSMGAAVLMAKKRLGSDASVEAASEEAIAEEKEEKYWNFNRFSYRCSTCCFLPLALRRLLPAVTCSLC